MFKTTLFKLINAADDIHVDGYIIDYSDDAEEDEEGNPVISLHIDDMEFYFADQEVEVRFGDCEAVTAVGDFDEDGPRLRRLSFHITRPIEEGDL